MKPVPSNLDDHDNSASNRVEIESLIYLFISPDRQLHSLDGSHGGAGTEPIGLAANPI